MHGIADFVNIPGSDALLHIAKPLSKRMGCTEQERDQRMHPGGREQDGRVVVRDQRRTLDHRVPFALEKFQKFRSELIRIHLSIKPPCFSFHPGNIHRLSVS